MALALISLCYLTVGGLWIAMSDTLGAMLFSNQAQLTQFQTYKGLAFVVFTALLLFGLLNYVARATVGPRLVTVPARWSLKMTLTLLVMATGLPLVAMVGVALQREAKHEMDKASLLVSSLADVLASDTLRMLEGHLRVGTTLAQRVQTRELNASDCDSVYSAVLTTRPSLSAIVLANAAGNTVCSARNLLGKQPAPVAQRNWLAARVPGSSSGVGVPEQDANGEWVVPIVRPVRDRVDAEGALVLLVRLESLHPSVSRALPPGGVASIFDGAGHVLARSADTARSVGRTLPDPRVLAYVRTQRSGEIIAAGLDGVERLHAFRPVADSPWFVVAGVPTESIYAQPRTTSLKYGLVAAGLLGLSVVLVTLIARRITSPMEALYQTAHRVAQGQFNKRAPEVGPVEVAEVAASFNHMLNRIPAIEQNLRDSEARHRSLVEMAPDGIVVQQDGAIVYANRGFRRMFGLNDDTSLDELNLSDFALPAERAEMIGDLERLGRSPASVAPKETTLRRLDGQPIDVELASSSVRLQDHIIVQSHLSELTARNQARRELEQANELLESRIQERTEALQTANDALASFSYSVAHDLRAPLRSIDGFTHLMASAVARGETEKAAKYLDRVVKNTRAMGQMIEGLLKLAHTGRDNLDMVPVDMQALVEEVLTETAGRDHTTITVDALPTVSADEVMLHQVWTNLISNALKYSVRHPHPEVRVGCETVGAEHVFSISDNGTGFDPEDASKLFGVFQRLPGATEFDGTGVGLAIVKRIVERHGGRVWAEGRPGEGATFHFALPASRAA